MDARRLEGRLSSTAFPRRRPIGSPSRDAPSAPLGLPAGRHEARPCPPAPTTTRARRRRRPVAPSPPVPSLEIGQEVGRSVVGDGESPGERGGGSDVVVTGSERWLWWTAMVVVAPRGLRGRSRWPPPLLLLLLPPKLSPRAAANERARRRRRPVAPSPPVPSLEIGQEVGRSVVGDGESPGERGGGSDVVVTGSERWLWWTAMVVVAPRGLRGRSRWPPPLLLLLLPPKL